MKPLETEPICLISFEVACILLGGGPTSRPSFWKAYRNELALNRKTLYENYHIRLCRPHLTSLRINPTTPVYYRNDRLVCEKDVHAPLLARLQ